MNDKLKDLTKRIDQFLEKLTAYISPKKLFSMIAVAMLTISLPTTLVLLNEQQDLRQRASGSSIARLAFEPTSITAAIDDKEIRLSVLAYGANNEPIGDNVFYEWGISSTGSVGTLSEISGSIATFIPKNIGTGDIFVTATTIDGQITQSIPVSVSADGNPIPTTIPSLTPTKIPLTPTTSPTLIITPTSIPSPTLTPKPAGFKAVYYPTTDFKGTPKIIEEAEIKHDWGKSAPFKDFPADGFSVRWAKNQYFKGGQYIFNVRNDDGMRVFIDGKNYYNSWRNQNSGSQSKTFIVGLSEGNHSIMIEYYEYKGNATAEFSWKEYDASEQRNSFLRGLFDRLRSQK